MDLTLCENEYTLACSGNIVAKAKCLEDVIVYTYKKLKIKRIRGTPDNNWERNLLLVALDKEKESTAFHLYILYPYSCETQPFRKIQLEKHKKYLNTYLTRRGIKFTFVTIEQTSLTATTKFNKGLLLNIGFQSIYNTWKKGKNTTLEIPYFCIHNSDLFPTKDVDYSFMNGFRDSFGGTSLGIGGIVVFDYLSYLRVNGHPNDYFGWGGEDICMKNRIDNDPRITFQRTSVYNNTECVEEIDHPRDSSMNSINLQKVHLDNYTQNGTRQALSIPDSVTRTKVDNEIHISVQL